MSYTVEAVRGWVGRDALDADGHLVGAVGHPYRDAQTGGVTWLAIVLDGEEDHVVPVPLEGCEPTGTAIRLPVLGDTLRTAPRFGTTEPLSPGAETTLLAHFGRRRRDDGPDGPQRLPDAEQARLGEIVSRLREAHALEGEGILRLEALRSALEDPEVGHDASLHAETTKLHRAGVEERLKLLEKTPSHLRDVRHGARAMAAGVKDRLGGDPVEVLRDAIAFEEREAAFYAELEALARAAGDTATADLAAAHRADEEAMAVTLTGSIARIDSPV